MGFPVTRLRRLRRSESMRSLVRETELRPSDLIYPVFVVAGSGVREPIHAMPGQHRRSVDLLVQELAPLVDKGLRAVMLFGVVDAKDERGSSATDPEGPVAQACAALGREFPDLVIMTDVCLCGYTSHGHCGIVTDGVIDNDETLEILADMAVTHARAGAHVVAPSDMMDGRVGAIRAALDQAGFTQTAIMAYSAKYASAYYGPFREAAGSAPAFGDRRTYQMDPANRREAIREAALDVEEGADIVMVKPALAYLDVVAAVKEQGTAPVAVYNVSGEYAMIKAAAAQGWIDERAVVLETLTGMKRAGADLILTYHAPDLLDWLT